MHQSSLSQNICLGVQAKLLLLSTGQMALGKIPEYSLSVPEAINNGGPFSREQMICKQALMFSVVDKNLSQKTMICFSFYFSITTSIKKFQRALLLRAIGQNVRLQSFTYLCSKLSLQCLPSNPSPPTPSSKPNPHINILQICPLDLYECFLCPRLIIIMLNYSSHSSSHFARIKRIHLRDNSPPMRYQQERRLGLGT